MRTKRRPGEVRDAIISALATKPEGASTAEIESAVKVMIGHAAPSSIRSYLRLNTPDLFKRNARGHYTLRTRKSGAVKEAAPTPYGEQIIIESEWPSFSFGKARLS